MTELSDPDNCEIKHKIEIIDHKVIFNGVEIARAPQPFTGKSKGKSQWTPARRLTFCKAVVYSIIPGEIKALVTNIRGNKGYESVPDDAELRRYIALYPAIVESPAVPEVIAVSAPIAPVYPKTGEVDPCPVLTMEEITSYPSAWELEKITPDVGIEQMDLKRDQIMIEKEFIEELYLMDSYNSIALENEYNKGEEVVLYDLTHPVISPVIIRTWTHGSMKISEVLVI